MTQTAARQLHDYDVELMYPADAYRRVKVQIYAVNRTQAAAKARKQFGGEVASVNMVG